VCRLSVDGHTRADFGSMVAIVPQAALRRLTTAARDRELRLVTTVKQVFLPVK
jgi:hypothetical protein